MERAAGGAHDAWLQLSDTTEPAGLGCRVALSCHFAFGHPVHAQSGKQESNCRDVQNTLCEIVRAHIKVWKAGERLLHAQPHCEKCACVM